MPGGRISGNSLRIPFMVNTQLGKPPVILSPKPNSLIKVSQVVINGTSAPQATVTVFLNNKPLASVKANNKGIWSHMLPSLSDGVYTLSAAILDGKMRPIASSERFNFVVNTRPITAPIIISPAANKTVITEKIFTLAGVAEPNAIITLSIDNKPFNQVRADQQGKWSDTIVRGPELTKGPHTISSFTFNGGQAASLLSSLSLVFA